MTVLRSPRTSEADGEIEVQRGAASSLRWSEITIAVFDENGDSVNSATGTVSAWAQKNGQGQRQAFEETVNLATDVWAWLPELSTVNSFFFSVSGLNAGYTYQITVNSWLR